MSVLRLARPELVGRRGYTAALGRFDMLRLHANEMPDEAEDATGLNRYPPPRPTRVTERLSELFSLPSDRLLLTRGSNEGIDLLVRAFCRADVDAVVVCPPTFGMYEVCAQVQGARVIETPLDDEFDLDVDSLVEAVRAEQGRAKLIFLCSPANPCGHHLNPKRVEALCRRVGDEAVIVLDQAYIEFSEQGGDFELPADQDNLVVLRTFSKAYGLAGLRCGVVIAHPAVIELLDSLLAPYSTPSPTITAMLTALQPENLARSRRRICDLGQQKRRLQQFLNDCPLFTHVYPSDSNFLLTQSPHAQALYEHLIQRHILVRSFFHTPRLAHALRVTVGNADDNTRLINAIEEFQHGD